jgi:hypothetical protein
MVWIFLREFRKSSADADRMHLEDVFGVQLLCEAACDRGLTQINRADAQRFCACSTTMQAYQRQPRSIAKSAPLCNTFASCRLGTLFRQGVS